MNNRFTPPTKAELKRLYGIPNDDFVIVYAPPDHMPSQAKISDTEDEQTFLEEVGELMGVRTYLKKNRSLRVVAVLLILALPKTVKEVPEAITTAKDFYSGLLAPFKTLPKQDIDWNAPFEHYANTVSSNSVVHVVVTTGTSVLPLDSGGPGVAS